MTVKRMDNVGIVVEDLDAAITRLVKCGAELNETETRYKDEDFPTSVPPRHY